jgi:hypothetical protein
VASDLDPAELAVKAAKDARRAMVLTLFAVAVAVLVLAIDNTIKRTIVDEAQKTRALFDRFQEVAGGLAEAVESGAGGGAADGGADPSSGGVADDAGTRPAVDGGQDGAGPAKAGGKAGGRARP